LYYLLKGKWGCGQDITRREVRDNHLILLRRRQLKKGRRFIMHDQDIILPQKGGRVAGSENFEIREQVWEGGFLKLSRRKR